MSARAGQRPKQPNPGPRRSPYVTPEVQGILERALRFRKWNADADKLRNLVEESCAKCGHDEAEGGIVNHCDACCRRITSRLWALVHGLEV